GLSARSISRSRVTVLLRRVRTAREVCAPRCWRSSQRADGPTSTPPGSLDPGADETTPTFVRPERRAFVGPERRCARPRPYLHPATGRGAAGRRGGALSRRGTQPPGRGTQPPGQPAAGAGHSAAGAAGRRGGALSPRDGASSTVVRVNRPAQRLIIIVIALVLVIPIGALGLNQLMGPRTEEPDPSAEEQPEDNRPTVDPAVQPQRPEISRPEEPAALTEQSAEGAQATLTYMLESYTYMMTTGDTSVWSESVDPDCQVCVSFLDNAEVLNEQGGYLV